MAPRLGHCVAASAAAFAFADPAHALVAGMAAWIWASWPATIIAALLALSAIAYGVILPLRRIVGYLHWRTGRLERLFRLLRAVAPADEEPGLEMQQQPDGTYALLVLLGFIGALGYGLFADREALYLAFAAAAMGGLWFVGAVLRDKTGTEADGRKWG